MAGKPDQPGSTAGEWHAAPEGLGGGLFNQIIQIAGGHRDASIAILTLMDEKRQWVWSRVGAPGLNPARLSVLAGRLAAEPAAFAVFDTRADSRWTSDPAVSDDPPIRACAGAPIFSPEGRIIGSLGVLSLEPGDPARAQESAESLAALARLVAGQVQLRQIFYTYETFLGDLERDRKALKEQGESFRRLAEHATDMITRTTPEGVYLYVSPSSRIQRGYAPEEMVGRSAFEFIHPDDVARVRRELAAKVATEETATFTYRIRKKDGAYIRVESSGHLLRDPVTSEPKDLMIVVRDITGRVDGQ